MHPKILPLSTLGGPNGRTRILGSRPAQSLNIVVDVDGQAGRAKIEALVAHYGLLPSTRRVKTGRGWHIYFSLPKGISVPNSARDGLDIRCDDGYVVGPPSVHASGSHYQWENEAKLAVAPNWLIEYARGGNGSVATALAASKRAVAPKLAKGSRPPEWSEAAETQLRSALAHIPARARGVWLNVGMAIHWLGWGEKGFRIWDDWSRTCPEKYSEEDQRRTWKSFERPDSGQSITHASIYHTAKQYGWSDEGSRGSSLQSDQVGIKRPCKVEPQKTTASTDEPGATYHRLAALTPYEYDRVRAQEAEKLGIRVATLDSEVDKIRPASESTAVVGRPLTLPSPEPWPDPVSGADLLNEIARAIHRYVVLPSEAIVASTLFAAYAHSFEAWSISPRLAITAPEMQCGKTTLLSVLEPLVPRPLKADNVTAAAVFRVVELARPTLMIDEADSFLKDNEELRGVLNSGHRSNGQVIRLVGDNYEARTFSTWCPTVIAAIGRIPSTLEDRSISISMRRALPEEKVSRFDDKERDKLLPLARKARRWADEHMEALRTADPRTPDALHGRAADNWRPLLAVADVAGGAWPDYARQACERLALSKSTEQDSFRVQLLADIRALFEDRRVERISSVEIVQGLCVIEGRPWQDWGRGKSITANQLARLLAPFGVKPKTMRIDKEQPSKGYERLDFDDPFNRYLPRITPPSEQ
jgi:hypothetical protein